MINGIINVYKEPGFTSHDVVAKLRGITHQKKIGHTGTLDPDAEGVLCVALGAATRVCDMLTDETKEYEAEMQLGITTDTQDTSGEILSGKEVNVTAEQLRQCISSFTGDIDQIPPMYSALKQNGKKLYELARAGITVERKARHITIYDIQIVSMDLPRAVIRVKCSKGTYIRTLCNDIGEKLGCGAAMSHLLRTRVGRFKVEDSLKLKDIEKIVREDRINDALVTLGEFFSDLKQIKVTETGIKKASNGNVLTTSDIGLHNTLSDSEEVAISGEDGFFYGIYRYDIGDGLLHPSKMFLC
ncbi:MAG: tRNA pseudouridine(55) synthase TruB [Lachnospiraceae bacterium]|nr:tRNA pseudouridine(55) synthase TruB [Lachnospiraceae bacterium]